MSLEPQQSRRAFGTHFSKLSRWDPLNFHEIEWLWPSETLRPLGSVLRVRKEKVDRSKHAFSDLKPITIHFDGSVEFRKIDANRTYSMALYWARPGDIVVSKIDLKNGAVAVIPAELGEVVVTGHFAVYRPDETQILPRYFHRLIQAEFVKEHLWRNKVGGEGRKEVKLSFFENLKVPIPGLDLQQAIVHAEDTAQNRFAEANEKQNSLLEELSQMMIAQSAAFQNLTRSRVVGVKWASTLQWDINAGRASVFSDANPSFIRIGEFTEERSDIVRPWEAPGDSWPVYGVNNTTGVFLNAERLGSTFTPGYAYKKIEKDDFFHNPTRANVGSLGIVPSVPTNAVTSPEYPVWRVTKKFSPSFMGLVVRTDFFKDLVSVNRVGGVKQRLFYSNLASIPVPDISINVQQDFELKKIQVQQELDAALAEISCERSRTDDMILGDVSSLVLTAQH